MAKLRRAPLMRNGRERSAAARIQFCLADAKSGRALLRHDNGTLQARLSENKRDSSTHETYADYAPILGTRWVGIRAEGRSSGSSTVAGDGIDLDV